MPEMPGKINIVAIDINSSDPNYPGFLELTAEEKINHILACIEASVRRLQDQDPTSMQIFVWREYGISEKNSKFASIETKKLLKEKMLALMEKYPSLTIIGGTVATKKHFANFTYADLDEIRNEYQTRQLKEIEGRENDPTVFLPSSLRQITLHHNQVKDLQQQREVSNDTTFVEAKTTVSDLSAAPKNPPSSNDTTFVEPKSTSSSVDLSAPPSGDLTTSSNANLTSHSLGQPQDQGVTVVRNRCFVAHKQPHMDPIQCHDKTTPYLETEEDYQDVPKNILFRPGKNTTRSAVMMLTHPHTKQSFPIGVEICAEHVHGVLQHELENEKETPTPLLHFIISDDALLDLSKTTADIVVQVDSSFKPKVITKNGLADDSIQFYQINALEKMPSLRGPLQLLYPFERVVVDSIDDTLKQLKKNDPLYDALIAMKNEFASGVKTTQGSEALFRNLQAVIDGCEKKLTKNYLIKLKNSFFSKPLVQSEELVRRLLITLKALMGAEQAKNLTTRDIHSRKDAPLLQPRVISSANFGL